MADQELDRYQKWLAVRIADNRSKAGQYYAARNLQLSLQFDIQANALELAYKEYEFFKQGI